MTETAALRPPQAAQALDGGAATGGLHPGGFVSATDPVPGQPLPYREDRSRPLALRWFTVGAPYRLFGLFDTGRHLYGVDPPGRGYLLGTHHFGRDEDSRLPIGGEGSRTRGLVGAPLP